MKNKHLIISGLASILMAFTTFVQAQEVAKPTPVAVLKTREALLKETTKLNALKIKLANAQAQVPQLEKEVTTANERAARSAKESKETAAKMMANTGDEKLAKRAKSAAKSSYNDSKKAQKLASNLKSNQNTIKSLSSSIEKSKAKIAKMDQQLKFSASTAVK